MKAASEHQQNVDRHRAFLEAVTGLMFGPALFDDARQAFVFRAFFHGKTESGLVLPAILESHIKQPSDFAR